MKNLIYKVGKGLIDLTKEKINGEWHNLIIDITNFCNLRCPFCCNDWSRKEKPILLKKEAFDKIIEIMPLIHESIFLSCKYEPTLHPEFTNFLNKIPNHSRKKCFFTTSLTTNISDATLEEFSHSGIHHINVSLDSFNPTVYESFRKGERFEHFISNLDRLVSIFSKNPDAPSIRYITMVFRQNVEEIPDILKKCNEQYLSSGNYFRDSFRLLSNNWPTQNKVSNDEWGKLLDKLNRGKYNFTITHMNTRWMRLIDKALSQSRISIDAVGLININNKDTHINIETLPDPFDFFKKNRL